MSLKINIELPIFFAKIDNKHRQNDALKTMKTEQFFRCLADPMRLRIILLLWQEGELCTSAVADVLGSNENQIRRQMALLSKNHLVMFRQKDLYHCYQLNPDLPLWVQKTLKHTYRGNIALLEDIVKPRKTHLRIREEAETEKRNVL